MTEFLAGPIQAVSTFARTTTRSDLVHPAPATTRRFTAVRSIEIEFSSLPRQTTPCRYDQSVEGILFRKTLWTILFGCVISRREFYEFQSSFRPEVCEVARMGARER